MLSRQVSSQGWWREGIQCTSTPAVVCTDSWYLTQLFYSAMFYPSPSLFYSRVFYSPLFYSPLFYSPVFYSPMFYCPMFYYPLFYSPVFYSPMFYCPMFYSPMFYYPMFYSPMFYYPLFYYPLCFLPHLYTTMAPLPRWSYRVATVLTPVAEIYRAFAGGCHLSFNISWSCVSAILSTLFSQQLLELIF